LLYPVHAGTARALWEAQVPITAMTGVSGGSIIAAAIAAGYTPGDELEQLILENLPRDMMDPTVLPFWHWGVIKGRKYLKELDRVFEGKTLGELKADLSIIVVDIATREHVVLHRDTHPDVLLSEAVRASISIPMVFAPVRFSQGGLESLYVDGGVSVGYPLDIYGPGESTIGFRFGTDYRSNPGEPTSIAQYIMACIETMMESSNREHMEDAIYARTCVLRPTGGGLDFLMSESDARALIDYGYETAKAWIVENL